MAMTGSLEEVLGKTHDLYMENRMTDECVRSYLATLKHENGEKVFGSEDIDKMMSILKKDKEKLSEL